MTILLQPFWQILLFSQSPETIPYSRILLVATLLLWMVLGTVSGIIIRIPVTEALTLAALEIGVVLGGSYLLLSLHAKANRFVQTATAITGCNILLNVMELPIDIWLLSVGKTSAELPVMLLILLTGWGVALLSHIWRHALDVPNWQGFLYAIGCVIIIFRLASLI